MPVPLRPGFPRAVFGLIVMSVAAAHTYASLALGGRFGMTAIIFLVLGFMFANVRGLCIGMVFTIPAYALLNTRIPLLNDQFGTILLGLAVFIGIVPGLFVAEGFLVGKVLGAVAAALAAAPAYVTFLVAFPFGAGPGIVVGSAMMFGGFGAAFGWLWGIGSVSLGATAHEGPEYFAQLNAGPRPQPARELRHQIEVLLPQVRENFFPLIRPLMTALGITAGAIIVITLIATNPIVHVSRPQTTNAAAAADVITGDKLVLFVVIGLVILGAVGGTAIGIALLVRLLNGQVEKAKKDKDEPVDVRTLPGNAFIQFILNWVLDILSVVRRSVTR